MNENYSRKNYIFDWKGALTLIGGMIVGISVIAIANVFSIFVFKEDLQNKNFYLLIINAAGFLGAILAFDHFICRPQTGKKLRFNFSSTNFITYFLIFPMMIGMMFIAEYITGTIPVTGRFFGSLHESFSKLMEQITNDKPTMILLAVVMAPIFEEIIFRGIIQKGFINKGMKPFSALFISSLVFGLAHGNPWQFVGAVLLGSVLGLVYYKTKSLLMPILLHAFNNLCSSFLIFYTNTENFSEAFHISEYFILGFGILLFSVFYFLFMKKYNIHYSKN
jgi:membrane protease YdiL (CAAX protease family)